MQFRTIELEGILNGLSYDFLLIFYSNYGYHIVSEIFIVEKYPDLKSQSRANQGQ